MTDSPTATMTCADWMTEMMLSACSAPLRPGHGGRVIQTPLSMCTSFVILHTSTNYTQRRNPAECTLFVILHTEHIERRLDGSTARG